MDSLPRFERTKEATDEIFLPWTLNPSSLRNKVNFPQQLFIPLSSPPSSTGLPFDSLTALMSIDPSPTRPSTNFNLSSQTAVAKAYFTAALGSSKEKRVNRLTSIAQSLSKAGEPSDGLYKLFWSERLCIFRPEVDFEAGPIPETNFEAEVACRLRRLKQARQNIEKADWEAGSLWLIFLAHEIEYISQSRYISYYTDQGVNSSSAARRIVEKYLHISGNDYKRCRNIIQVIKIGGPASLLIDPYTPRSMWEKDINMDDITLMFAYIKAELPYLYKWIWSHNPAASYTFSDGFMMYGWSFLGLLESNTNVTRVLKPYLHKRPHVDGGPMDSEPEEKRRRVGPNHDFLTTSFNQFSSSSNNFNQETSRIYNTVESTAGSNSLYLISSDARNRTRDLTDPAMGYFGYAINGSSSSHLISSDARNLTDPAMGNFGYAINGSSSSHLISSDARDLTDPAMGNFSYAVNSSNGITDLATAEFFQYMDNLDYGY